VKNNLPSIILIRPQLPENIGMAARAMDNNGFKKLILVSPREKWPNQIAINSSGNSKQIIKNVKIYQTVEKALSSFNYVFATSNRKRFLNKPFYNNFKKIINKVPLNKKIAIVFGPENSGLSNEDLMLCDSIINIELSKSNPSLNLSHAVLLTTYKWTEIIKNKNITNKNFNNDLSNIASKKEFLNFMLYLKSQLQNVNFLYPKHKSKSMFNNIQTMFLRASLSKSEIQTLWGMIKKLSKTSKNT
tara:strand:- start:35 stop:769 length:735 start_codon:yes stop_codon:yes gene_type:complete